MNRNRLRSTMVLACLVSIALSSLATLAVSDSENWLTIPGAECLPDTSATNNACSSLGVACCAADQPCMQYCSTFNSAGACNKADDVNCYQKTNQSCGTQNGCGDKQPMKDGSGNNINCTGNPDICSPSKPLG